MVTALEAAFVLLAVSTGAVQLLFGTFHVELFRTVYGLDATAFAAGHAVYAVWNTANDLGSGVVADRMAARVGGSRVPLARAAGLLWVTVGFLFPWWRWTALMPLPVQFVAALSLFDGFYSFVAIVEGALLAELATDTASRARIGRLTSIASMLVLPLVSRLGFAAWDVDDLSAFRALASCVSCVAAVGVATGSWLMERHGRGGRPAAAPAPRYGTLPLDPATTTACASCRDAVAQAGPGLSHRNFLAFCGMDSLLEAENVFQNAFRLTFASALLPAAGWSPAQIGNLLSAIPTVS